MTEPSNLIEGGVRVPIEGVDPRYGMLIKGGEAAEKKTPPRLYHLKTPPLMSDAQSKRWDEYQAKNRSIKVRVTVVPAYSVDAEGRATPFPGYWSAKRFFGAGSFEYMVSPHELVMLESEDPARLRVELLSERKRAPSVEAVLAQIAAQVRKEEELQARIANGEVLPEDLEEKPASSTDSKAKK